MAASSSAWFKTGVCVTLSLTLLRASAVTYPSRKSGTLGSATFAALLLTADTLTAMAIPSVWS